jgi:hypothetical protein
MERRGFLSRLGLLVGAAVVTPNILQGMEKAPEPKPVPKPEVLIVNDLAVVPKDNTEPLSLDEQLTEGFFKYLDKHADFEWVRVDNPLYRKPNGQFIQIPMYRTPANYYPLWQVSAKDMEGSNWFNRKIPQSDEEYYEYFIYPEVCTMINKTRARHLKEGYTDPSYLMSLHFTPIMYDPKDYSPQRGILLRGQI